MKTAATDDAMVDVEFEVIADDIHAVPPGDEERPTKSHAPTRDRLRRDRSGLMIS